MRADHAARLARDLGKRTYARDFRLAFCTRAGFRQNLRLVIGLSALHGYFATVRRAFGGRTQISMTRVFFGFVNEVPTLLMVAIVILVVFKPF